MSAKSGKSGKSGKPQKGEIKGSEENLVLERARFLIAGPLGQIEAHNSPIGNVKKFPHDQATVKAIWEERLAAGGGSNIWVTQQNW